MSKYFENFPTILYNKKIVTDISKNFALPKKLYDDPYIFLPYTIEGEDRPEHIAYHYYGSVEYTWLVYLANNIIDPITDWHMNNEDFNQYIIKKYKDQSNTSGYDVITWTQDTNNPDNILYYRNVLDNNIIISKDTYTLDDSIVASEWETVRVYDDEVEKNEAKRIIQLINTDYKEIVKNSLKEVAK